MKKIIAILCILTLVLSLGTLICSAEEEKNVVCYVGGTINVDGEIDEVWNEVDFIPVNNLKTGEYMGDSSKTVSDYAALNCKVLWDGRYTMYILFVV